MAKRGAFPCAHGYLLDVRGSIYISCVKITLDQPRVRFPFETAATALQKNRWICLARVWTTKLKYLATEMKESKYSTESTVTLSRLTPPSFEKYS